MNIQKELQHVDLFKNLDLLANQVVEGFISGIHKSPFHGFSSEFAEHRIYNPGESTRHIDWKLYGKTDKLYTKRYEEETNMRCHIIIDNSSSMHYPTLKQNFFDNYNKIGFSTLATAALMNLLKRQRDAVGLSIYADSYEFYAPEKGSERHHQMLLHQLSQLSSKKGVQKETKTYTYLHQIAEKIHRRSMIFLFTDMFQTETDTEALFEALKHLKYNKHEVVLFHTVDTNTEALFEFGSKPKKFTDVETGETVDLYAEHVKDVYQEKIATYFKELKLQCAQYKIKYVEANIQKDLNKILQTYLTEKHIFI
ncbi:Protein of unknown function DUF58 [Pustulibacterium marinum]|uniref:DUF58 domain-containing protein n=1 Tax=Pustulibacterium marinum TaxID=1224947 RepID=A0A1I7EZJ8_9FLAO|nr:DUF58 domain-containing protein [Pustulibacterium marinum]SFU29346.1 Protein of unknown function DUF58 [Pustulibacterium marinum]